MTTRFIKFGDSTTTYLPVTIAKGVQYSYGNNQVMSVQEAIQMVAGSAAYINDNVVSNKAAIDAHTNTKTLDFSYNTTNGNISLTGVHAKDSGNLVIKGEGLTYTKKSGNNIIIGTTAREGTVTSVTLTQGDGIKVSDSGTAITASGTRTISHDYVGAVAYTYTAPTNKYFTELKFDKFGHLNTYSTSFLPDYSNTYSPINHTHGNITNDGKLASASKVVVTDGNSYITTSSNITTTELGYLDGATGNIQNQIDSINSTISSGMHMRGTTTTVPGASTAYVIGDSYVYSPSNASSTITIPAAQSQSGYDEVVGKGDMITYIEGGKWAVIQNNIGDYVSHIKTTDDDKWIQATPTSNASGDVIIDIKHIGPYNSTDRNATATADGNQLVHGTGKVITALSYTADDKGHITKVSYTLSALPAEGYDFKTITPGSDANSTVNGGTANTTNVVADSQGDTLTITGGNRWITTGGNDSTDTIYINHRLVQAGTNTSVNATGNSSLTDEALVITALSYNVDAAGHVSAITATTSKLPKEHVSKNIIGASTGTADSQQTTNGNVYLRHLEYDGSSYTATSTHKIVGSGSTTVTSDASGNITINTPTISVGDNVLKYSVGQETDAFVLDLGFDSTYTPVVTLV